MLILILGVGFFINLPIISAQEAETVEQEISEEIIQEDTTQTDRLREAESYYSFGGDTETNLQLQGGSTIGAIFRMLLMLALVAVAIYGVVYFIKKKTNTQNIEKDPFLKVLASSHLGNNRYAHIVGVGNKAWLLGSSDGGVNLIGEIEDKELIDAMLLEESEKSAYSPSGIFDFSAMLRKLGVGNQDSRASSADELRKRRERLKGL